MYFNEDVFKDHEKGIFINDLRDVAVEFGHTQQLRERISRIVERVLNKIGCAYDDKCLLCEAPTDCTNWAAECDDLKDELAAVKVAFMEVSGGVTYEEHIDIDEEPILEKMPELCEGTL